MREIFGNGRNRKDLYIFAIGALLIIVLFITVIRNYRASQTLEVYTESNVVDADDGIEEETLDIDAEIYTYPEGFSISIPADWQRVTKSGYDTYVHAPTGSSIQIQVLDYDPEINNVGAESESVAVAENGMTFVSFTRNTTSSYELMYQDYQNSIYDYIEEVYWDRDTIIKLVCTMNDAYYSDMAGYYEFIINSFAWDRADPIPEDMVLWYQETGDFEFAYPLSWYTGVSSGTIVAADEVSGATMTVSVSEYNYALDSTTGSDITSLLSTGRSNFMLNWYDATSTSVQAESTYVNNYIQYTNKLYLFANGAYLYTICFDYEQGTIDDAIPDTCASLFREFISGKIAEAAREEAASAGDEESDAGQEEAAEEPAETAEGELSETADTSADTD